MDISITEHELNKLLFFNIIYGDGDKEISIHVPSFDTVGDLKEKLFHNLEIPLSKQVIDGWYKYPESDNDTLGICCLSDGINYLVVSNKESNFMNTMDMSTNVEMIMTPDEIAIEMKAAMDFIEYFSENFDDGGLLFHVCRLEDAVSEACFTSLEKRKILLLYFHNKNDKFATIFGKSVAQPEVKNVLSKRFFLLGWDVENEAYHNVLLKALNNRTEFSALTKNVEMKACCALLIVPIKNCFTIFSCIRNKVSKNDFLNTLVKTEEFFVTENLIEQDLAAESKESANDMDSTNYQQMMLDLLGDRDYDSFDHNEFDLLKEKIGFALNGPPQSEKGYDKSQKKKIEDLFKTIVHQNNLTAKWKDRVVMSCIYNCTEPLPAEKNKRLKKYKDYNPNTDLTPIPLFILRKCKNSENPCRTIIDDSGRVYRSWREYLMENKLEKCEMILPLNGRYEADEKGNVKLERHLSPACGIGSKILYGADMFNTAAGLVSGGIFIAAAIPAITIAPVALIAAGATGLGVGLYSLGRSTFTLYDRTKHKETLSIRNSEARGAYLNIVAGSLGFVGASASMAVSQLAAQGFRIGQGATAAVNVINVANIGVSGVTVVNSGYDVIDQWLTENRRPSMLTIVQLSSSILFFGHAVYSFKTVSAMIEESQARTLKEYQESLRSNRHRKTFNKMMKETIRQNEGNVQNGQAEVIKTIKTINQNRDEVFAALTRANKEMNKNDIQVSADNGSIKLNGTPIDLVKFGKMDKNKAASFLQTLPNAPEPSSTEVKVMSSSLKRSLGENNGNGFADLAFRLLNIFNNTDESTRDKIINAAAEIFKELFKGSSDFLAQLEEMFPGCEKFLRICTMVSGYFQKMMDEIEEQYQKWLETKDPLYEHPKFSNINSKDAKRELFDIASNEYFIDGTRPTETLVHNLLEHLPTWFSEQLIEYEQHRKRKEQRVIHSGKPRTQVTCSDCGGIYYQ